MLRNEAVRQHRCGVQTTWSESESAEVAVLMATHALDKDRIGQVLVFFSADYDIDALNDAFGRALPGIPVAGCSTAGGICAAGSVEQGLVLLAFPREGFRIASTCLSNISNLDVGRAGAAVRALRHRFDGSDEALSVGRFALTLIDGLANVEEIVVSTVAFG